ncbi:MAG: hypothetical protein HY602_01660 [Parcubacteria group bacterium]|nr:hypothetical protein [Parcubacteria group bacterium]
MRTNRSPEIMVAITGITLSFICCGFFGLAAEGNFPRVTKAPFAAGRGAAYFLVFEPPRNNLQKVLYAGWRCERGEWIAWADQSIASAARPDGGLPYTVIERRLTFPSAACN